LRRLIGRAAGQAFLLAASLVVPLHVVQGTHGEPRLGIDLTIGSDPVRVLVDTGSSGLRLLANVLHPDSARRSGHSAGGGYGSGLRLQGEEAYASLTIGGAHGDGVPIELVDSYHFADNGPQRTPEMFGGVFPGILGINLFSPPRGACCMSPLPGLSDGIGKRYILRASFRGPQLILNPDDALAQTFTMADVGDNGWPQGCITVDGLLTYDFCGEVLFDTGSPGLTVFVTNAVDGTGYAPPGAVAHLRLAQWDHDFTSGRGVRIDVRQGPSPMIIVGLSALQQIDLLFDFDHRQIGVRSH
jgi:hypothetical protein